MKVLVNKTVHFAICLGKVGNWQNLGEIQFEYFNHRQVWKENNLHPFMSAFHSLC